MASNGIPSWSTTAASNVLANTGVNWDEGQAPSTVNDSARQILADLATWYGNLGPSLLENFSFTCSVGSSALTIALKRRDGSDPSTDQPVRIAFRNATAATGDYSILKVTAATSLVVSSGSTLGTSSGALARLFIVGFDDGGTFRIGIYNPSGSSYVAPREDQLNSSTAEGGSGGADSAQVYYTGTAVSSKAMRILAYIDVTEATAGTWASAPSKVQLFGPGVMLPRSVYQSFLGSDVSLNNTSNYFNIVNTGSIGAAGEVWLIRGVCCMQDTGGSASFLVRVWDGSSTVYVESNVTTSASNLPVQGVVETVLTLSGPTTFHLSAKDATRNTGAALTTGNSGTANKATWILALRIS